VNAATGSHFSISVMTWNLPLLRSLSERENLFYNFPGCSGPVQIAKVRRSGVEEGGVCRRDRALQDRTAKRRRQRERDDEEDRHPD
jgi:hypothetical protein